jgi:hypothetical protein
MGYAGGTGKKDTSKAVLLVEDVAEALREVRGRGEGGAMRGQLVAGCL